MSSYYLQNKQIYNEHKTKCCVCGEDTKCCLEFTLKDGGILQICR